MFSSPPSEPGRNHSHNRRAVVPALPSADLTSWITRDAVRTAYRQPRVSHSPRSPCDRSSSPRISPMVTFNLLQQLHDLDRSSPQFQNQFSNLVRGEEFRNSISNLRGDELARFVEYLKGVSLQIILVRSYSRRRCRSSPQFPFL